MTAFVLDCSVTVAWILPDEASSAAARAEGVEIGRAHV